LKYQAVIQAIKSFPGGFKGMEIRAGEYILMGLYCKNVTRRTANAPFCTQRGGSDSFPKVVAETTSSEVKV
jgi:hypothetical protein